MDYEYIICFETHVELNTKTKLFCGCEVSYDAAPNTRVCPVCTGQPGALPVLNKKAVQYAVKAGLALNCTINTFSRFARKNYFYPDLPKGYQISQYELPFCENGFLEITDDGGNPYKVGIKRIHLEEDAGKLMHSDDSSQDGDFSLVDYNRSSVPLLEIVTDHENNPLHSMQEARAYLEKLRQTLRYIDISECAMEKGQLRCDVNISIRPKGSKEFGNRSEIKNMSSFRFIMEALEYEIKRQKDIIESGGTVTQETRLYDETKKLTLPMRSKEDAPDYRYFPDPDLLEVKLDQEFVNQLETEMPELPDQQLERIISQYGITRSDAIILTKDKAISEYFTSCAIICEDRRKLSNWIIKELFKLLNDASIQITSCPVKPKDFVRLIDLVSKGEATEAIGRTVLAEMFLSGKAPDSIINEKGLKTIADDNILTKAIEETITENPEPAARIKAGDSKPIDFILGQVMRKTKGKADPKKVRELIEKSLT
jgi:aspartyl-tRNA(Asn)/glutamyl-tRNA(Gln) amidotransferase subunit B